MAENDARRLEEAQKRVEQKALLKAERAAMKALVGSRMEDGGGGRRDGYDESARSGDWRCPKCAANVFASKSKCFKCGTAKVEGVEAEQRGGGKRIGGEVHGTKSGDWPCPKCRANVFASKSICFKCGTPKPDPGKSLLSAEAPSWEQDYQKRRAK